MERKELLEKFEIELKDLFSKDEILRRKSSVKIDKLARGVMTGTNQFLLTNNKTIEILLHAIKGEKDEKTLLNLLRAIGNISERYEVLNILILRELKRYFDHPSKDVRLQAGIALAHFNSSDVWKHLSIIIDNNPNKKNNWYIGLAIARFGTDMSFDSKKIFFDPLKKAYLKEKNADSKIILIVAMGKIGDASIILFLEQITNNEMNSIYLNDEIILAIKRINGRKH